MRAELMFLTGSHVCLLRRKVCSSGGALTFRILKPRVPGYRQSMRKTHQIFLEHLADSCFTAYSCFCFLCLLFSFCSETVARLQTGFWRLVNEFLVRWAKASSR